MPIITCIFCLEDKEGSDEHVIPGSLGGVLLINYVCVGCNSKLGSEVDAELLRNRHIYDTFLGVRKEIGKDFKFQFIEAHFEHPDGRLVRATKSNVGRRMLPTKHSDGKYVSIDPDDDDYVINNMRKRGRERMIRGWAIEQAIQRYRFHKLQAKPGDRFYDPLTGVGTILEESTTTVKTIMEADTPSRFVAKACVEMAHVFGVADQINELEALRNHALVGGSWKGKLSIRQEGPTGNPEPGHILAFSETQFSVQFFANFGIGVDITWKNEPRPRYLVNHLGMNGVFEAILVGDKLSFNDAPFVARRMPF